MRDVLRIIKTFITGFLAEKPFQLAAALSYFTLLSMVPMFLLLTGVAGLAFGRDTARAHLLDQVRNMVGSQQADVVRALLAQSGSHHASVVTTIVGIVAMLIGATTVFAHLQFALNRIWGVAAAPPTRSAILRLLGARALALAIVLGMACVLLASIAVSTALAGAHAYFSGLFPGAETVLQALSALVSFAVVWCVIALLFKFVPDAEIGWRDVALGAFVTSALFTIGKFALGMYLARLRYSSAGAAGALILLAVWVYYSAVILFLGAKLTHAVACRGGRRVQPRSHAKTVAREQ